MKKQHKGTIKSIIKRQGHWTGFLTANKVNPRHINGCWQLGFKVTFTSLEELEKTVDRFAYYNCNGELGNRVSFYEKQ
ncbi:hypothetical protein [Bacillus sp. (in: firmicutes)]|uniref:hypothetical protein n=1 Tax=Bacillus sp. TaxID=1409 RepID=UPI000EEA319E|nr:hypothetical protein [Bacillus sp. (in: firmicutes)]HCO79989.1 hypothetical protein [Bacillus sp. (in: firmicutes)]